MARLAVVVDRSPKDEEWKGAFAWKTILSLAESQHEVLALTTLDPAEIELQHPRLTVARPSAHFGPKDFPHWLRAWIQFNPDVIHTFALKKPARFHFWPLINLSLQPFTRLRKFSSVFDPSDYAPFPKIDMPFEWELQPFTAAPEERPFIVIPEPVSRWSRPMIDLILLNEFLMRHRELDCHIVGGWGEMALSERRTGWQTLQDVSDQIHMGRGVTLFDFIHLVTKSSGLWLNGLSPQSFPARIAGHVGRTWSLTTWGEVPELSAGSPANFLSRLYSQP